MSDFENFKVHKNEFPVLNDDQKKEVMGRLKALEELSTYIDVIRESYTRELVVNGVQDEKDLYASSSSEKSESDVEYRRASP